MKRYLLFFIPIILSASIEEDLLLTLNEASEIATETKLNIDKTPSTVTVLKRDFIKASGAKRVIDLLRYIPGIEISMSSSGKRQIIVRGLRSVYRDKIKLLINGVDVTNTLHSNQFYYYNFPASLIERVEFTKSPNAILYGSNAFVGALNIITTKENRLYFALSDERYWLTSFNQQLNLLGGRLNLDAHISNSTPPISSLATYKIDLFSNTSQLFRPPLPAHTKEKSNGIGANYTQGEWSFDVRWQHLKKGSFFGIARVVPIKKDKFVDLDHLFVQLSFQHYLSDDQKIEAKLGWINYLWDGEYRTFPYDLQPSFNPDKDLIIGAYINEQKSYLKTNYKYFGSQHTINIGLEGGLAKMKDSYYLQYIPYLHQAPTPKRGDENVIPTGITRKTLSLYAQDLWQLSSNLSCQLGIRYDHFSDTANHTSYQSGLVYNINENNTFKILYNNAFRAPSWVELFAQSKTEFHGNPSLKPEKIYLTELQYIYQGSFQLKLNYYQGSNKDAIIKAYGSKGEKIYQNGKDIDIKGYEISFLKPFTTHKFFLNYSHNLNNNPNKTYMDTREHLINSYLYLKFKEFSSFTSLNWGSEIKLHHTQNIPPCFRIDQTFNYELDDFEFQIGVKNLTDHKNYLLISPSDIIQHRFLLVHDTGRVPACGREFFFAISKKW